MQINRRAVAIFLGLTATMLPGALPLTAQEPGSTKSAAKTAPPTTKRTYDPSRRVPDYFGQIGLTPEQKESIYKIRAKHQQKIDELEKQIAQIHAQMLSESEALLTDTQRQLLEHRRRAASAPLKKVTEPAK
jgi:hypothetical protein